MKEISYLILVSLFFVSLGASAKEFGYTFTADFYKSDVLCRIAACEAAQNSARKVNRLLTSFYNRDYCLENGTHYEN